MLTKHIEKKLHAETLSSCVFLEKILEITHQKTTTARPLVFTLTNIQVIRTRDSRNFALIMSSDDDDDDGLLVDDFFFILALLLIHLPFCMFYE